VPPLGRTGAWPIAAVKFVTTLVLLRHRFKLTVHGRRERLLLVEEAGVLAFDAVHSEATTTGKEALALLDHPATGDLALTTRQRLLTKARDRLTTALNPTIEAHARHRAVDLEKDHARVRAAGAGVPRVTVDPALPSDIIGLYLLLPSSA
jgi:hypothetical protein